VVHFIAMALAAPPVAKALGGIVAGALSFIGFGFFFGRDKQTTEPQKPAVPVPPPPAPIVRPASVEAGASADEASADFFDSDLFNKFKPIVSKASDFVSRAGKVAREAAEFIWERSKRLAIATFDFSKVLAERAVPFTVNLLDKACAKVQAWLEPFGDSLDAVWEASAELRLEQSQQLHFMIQALEVAGVPRIFTKSPPRNKNQIPQALAA
jgi:hypothetical protein